jgi:hypothetical protein
MFAAALLDLRPELAPALKCDLDAGGFAEYAELEVEDAHDDLLTGRRFFVRELDPHRNPHRSHREIKAYLQRAALAPAVRERALHIFALLAEAEAAVHGGEPDAVSFHEVGAWDSIVDVVTAAWLIEKLGAVGWGCAPVPLGRGRVQTAHGVLPVPTPATALLLEGFPVFQDEHEGERVTPTGAAILKHLAPRLSGLPGTFRLEGSGIGFGTRRFPGMSNVLRVLAFTAGPAGPSTTVLILGFEVDDQSPEDLAVAVERLREEPGVLDVVQWPVFGKKGRVGAHVQLLAEPASKEEVVRRCLSETTTLGVRWSLRERAVLPRELARVGIEGRVLGTKVAVRPDGRRTAKPEMDDIAGAEGGIRGRERLREQAVKASMEQGKRVDEC